MKIKPQGKIVATGEDGVPWELYENGYLLFKPTKEKNTLTNPYQTPSWKEKYGEYLIAIGFTDKVFAPENSSNLFNIAIHQALSPQLQYIEASKIDTSYVTNMAYMFYEATRLIDLDVSNWDTSKVTNMSWMFYDTGLITLDLGNWNTSKVTNMSYMFKDSKLLKMVNMSNWNTSNVADMANIFWNNNNLELVDFSNVNQGIQDLLNTLITKQEISLHDDCVIIVPN